LGAFLGLTLLKFGNPTIMESFVTPPADVWEFFLASPWPIGWGYTLLAPVAALGLVSARGKTGAPLWLILLPLVWLVWQAMAASYSLEPQLSLHILMHFAACVVCFYLGLFSLGRAGSLASFWLGILCAFLLVLASGWEQHFGGLAATRRYFYANIYPTLKSPLPPEYYKRLNSNRIFATLFYPNTLAGVLLLLLPPLLGVVASARRLTIPARAFVAAVLAFGALACLCWSGSKGGWLLMLVLSIVALLRLPLGKRFRVALVAAVLFLGLAGFFWQFAAFLKRGAPSASARLDYWQAAVRITMAHPLLGSGPGTFGRAYLAIRRPESEPTKVTHNDYLEQASDSGLPGFIAYGAFILGALLRGAPRAARGSSPVSGRERLEFAVWLGLLGWSLQGFFEFGLYVPALAWPALSLMGWLLRKPWTNPGGLDKMRPQNANPVSKRA
jgi:O-antigen ligase